LKAAKISRIDTMDNAKRIFNGYRKKETKTVASPLRCNSESPVWPNRGFELDGNASNKLIGRISRNFEIDFPYWYGKGFIIAILFIYFVVVFYFSFSGNETLVRRRERKRRRTKRNRKRKGKREGKEKRKEKEGGWELKKSWDFFIFSLYFTFSAWFVWEWNARSDWRRFPLSSSIVQLLKKQGSWSAA
jgi:hypothetical protein